MGDWMKLLVPAAVGAGAALLATALLSKPVEQKPMDVAVLEARIREAVLAQAAALKSSAGAKVYPPVAKVEKQVRVVRLGVLARAPKIYPGPLWTRGRA